MQKEPIGLALFRDLLIFAVFAFLGLLYWSSLLLEEDLSVLRQTVGKLESEITNLHANAACQTGPSAAHPSSRPLIDDTFPNLMTPDPFYETTLPKLLPKDFHPSGERKMAIVAKPDNLHPFSNWSYVSDWVSQCSGSVAAQHFGRFETLAPDMAIKLEERPIAGSDLTEFWVHLRNDLFWEPLDPAMFAHPITLSPHFLEKKQVTAEDFKFYLDALMNPWVQAAGAVALRNYLGDIEELRVVDPLTFAVRWKVAEVKESNGEKVKKIKYVAKWMTGSLRPLASFVYKYFADGTKIVADDSAPDTYRTSSAWAQNFNEHWAKNIIVSCGPWIFDKMSDRQISFRRNPHFYNPLAVLVDRSVTFFKESSDSIWEDFKAGKLDSYALRPDQLTEWESFQKSELYADQLKKGQAVQRLDYVDRSYIYIGWNEARSLFGNQAIRQAMTLAIDRQRIIAQNLRGLGVEVTGPFFYTSKAYDNQIKPWPFDPEEALQTLEKAGWSDRRGTGILEKLIDGKPKPFAFSLTYYVKNPTSLAIGEYVSLALKEIGIDCRLNGVDIADLSAVFDDRSFDALLLGWTFGSPPEEPRQLWSSAGAKQKGSSNAIGFANSEVDRIIDELDYEYDAKRRETLYHQFDAIIHKEAPYTFLFTPKVVFLYRNTLQNVWIPSERQDLVPGADVAEPQPNIFWLKA